MEKSWLIRIGVAVISIFYGREVIGQCAPQELAKLLASDGATGDNFGFSVGISVDVAIVGAELDDDRGTDFGSAYVYRWSGSVWYEEQKLSPSDNKSGRGFGRSVSISGNVAVIGAFSTDSGYTGSAFVFRWNGEDWVEEQQLLASDGSPGDYFARKVAMHGNVIVVGAPADDYQGLNNPGSAYVFRWNGATWVEEQKILASDHAAEDFFGIAVEATEDLIIIGARNDDLNAGAAYVYRWDGSTWDEEQKLVASDRTSGDLFGQSVSVASNAAVIGSVNDDDLGHDSGSAYIFRWDGSVWNEEQKLVASDGSVDDFFGISVSTNGEETLVGAYGDQSWTGAGYLFRWDGSNWTEESKLLASDHATGDFFGISVEMDNDFAILGAPEGLDLGDNAGSAYIFDLNCETGIPATLTDFAMRFGSLLSGGLQELIESDDSYFRTRSQFGFIASEPNLVQVDIGAVSAVQAPGAMDVTVEARINQPGGTVRLRLKNWNTNSFEQVHLYSIGTTETVETIEDIAAGDFVRASDGRIELSIRTWTMAVFSPLGFEQFTDQVVMVVR